MKNFARKAGYVLGTITVLIQIIILFFIVTDSFGEAPELTEYWYEVEMPGGVTLHWAFSGKTTDVEMAVEQEGAETIIFSELEPSQQLRLGELNGSVTITLKACNGSRCIKKSEQLIFAILPGLPSPLPALPDDQA